MPHDLEGNVLSVDDTVYVLAPVKEGSRSKRLVRGYIREIIGQAVLVWINEGQRMIRVYGKSIVVPRQ